jgi:hypothetical protein
MDKVLALVSAVTARFREPSTWASIASLLALGGMHPATISALSSLIAVAPDLIQIAILVLGGSAGLAGIVLPEAKTATPPPGVTQ